MNIETWLSHAKSRIASDSPALDAELLLCHHIHKNRAYLRAFGEHQLDNCQLAALDKDLQQLANAYPIAYILGKKDFWDMTLNVTPATLIPRNDTETLIDIVSNLFPLNTTASFVDLGTGSGAIAIALSRIFPQANMMATDMSEEALNIAQANAKQWQKATITFQQNHWLEGFRPDSMDCIVSNPPYIEENDPHLQQLTYEPINALIAPHQGLGDITTIIRQSETVLKADGWLAIEHGYNQGQAVRQLFNQYWQSITTYQDLAQRDRVTVAQRKQLLT